MQLDVDQGTAQANGLITTTDTTAYMGVDYTSVLADDGSQGGRQSVRLTSKATYTEGVLHTSSVMLLACLQ